MFKLKKDLPLDDTRPLDNNPDIIRLWHSLYYFYLLTWLHANRQVAMMFMVPSRWAVIGSRTTIEYPAWISFIPTNLTTCNIFPQEDTNSSTVIWCYCRNNCFFHFTTAHYTSKWSSNNRHCQRYLFAADYQSEIESLHKQPMGKNQGWEKPDFLTLENQV